jgi:hypothetical protein
MQPVSRMLWWMAGVIAFCRAGASVHHRDRAEDALIGLIPPPKHLVLVAHAKAIEKCRKFAPMLFNNMLDIHTCFRFSRL